MSYDTGLRRNTPLAERLKARIRREGPITVYEYMRICLTDPELGYYERQQAIGAHGDFITAPEVSQVFGELIGLWAAVVWQTMGSPEQVHLIELGPGRGTLLNDALRAARIVPRFLDAVELHLVETSAPLAAAQRDILRDWPRLAWHSSTAAIADGAGTIPPGPAIIIANEFLDACPISQLVRCGSEWRQRMVGLGPEGGLCFTEGADPIPEPGSLLDEPPARAPVTGDVFERIGSAAELGADTLRIRAGLGPMAALFIDYGYDEPALGDTLQAVRHHRSEHPLASPGEADLTAHVSFPAFARACRWLGPADDPLRHARTVDGPVTQAEFLGRLGIVERASRLMSANPAKAGAIEAGATRLMAPNGMGTRFKVLGVRSSTLPPLPGLA